MVSCTYLNTRTGESTTDRAVFRKWLHAGYQIEVRRNGRLVITFNDLGLYL